MAIDYLTALSALGRLLPGYLEGERLAMSDNWRDANQYNQVLTGQMQNDLSAATYADKVRQSYLNTLLSGQNYDST